MNERKISHVQGKGSIAHNNRLFMPKNVNSARTCHNITYICQDIADAYDFLFSQPVEDYNNKQKRSDRKIRTSYYEYLFNHIPCNTVIESPNGQKSFYEDVVQIGTKDDTGIGSPDAETAKTCLDEYMKGFQERNPNFYVFNAVLHMDEATPHLHIDYIPVGHYKRGVSVQNGLAQALDEMGYGKGKDAINRWRKAERQCLKDICEAHNIEIAEETLGRGYSMKVEEYKEHQDKIHSLQEQKNQLHSEIEPLMNAKAIADDITVNSKKVFGNNYIVSEQTVNEMTIQKKALAVQENEVKVLQNHLAKERLLCDTRQKRLDEAANGLIEKEQELNKRENQVFEREQHADDLMMKAQNYELDAKLRYELQIELNERYNDLKKDYSELKVKYLELKKVEIENQHLKLQLKENTDERGELICQHKTELSEKENLILEFEKKVQETEKTADDIKNENTELRKKLLSKDSFIDTLYEIGEFLARKLRMHFEDILDMRIKGFSLNHIFNKINER